jgi:Cu+-exporting ATPase
MMPSSLPSECVSGANARGCPKGHHEKITPASRFTCPMRPEVDQVTAGDCPRCGMALEPHRHCAPERWACPMHPEIVRDELGSCPICGMALEPVEEMNPEVAEMARRFRVSAP